MPLHCWCYLLGILALFGGATALAAPDAFGRLLKALPRNRIAAIVLSALAWIWAGYALWNMDLDLIQPFKRYIPYAVAVCLPLTWFWLDNLLPCRALGAILTLFPYELLHAARTHPSPWRLVVVTLAYLCIVKGMILLLYPWKMREAIAWITARPIRMRLAGAVDVSVGLLLIALGATVLR